MDKKYFQGFPPVLGNHHIQFQAPAVVSEKVYIPSALVALFHNANVLVKALALLFTQIATVIRKIVLEWPKKMQFVPRVGGNSSVALKFLSVLRWFTKKFVNTISVTAGRTVQLRPVLRQTLGPPWVLLFEGRQIYRPRVSPCLSVGTSWGK